MFRLTRPVSIRTCLVTRTILSYWRLRLEGLRLRVRLCRRCSPLGCARRWDVMTRRRTIRVLVMLFLRRLRVVCRVRRRISPVTLVKRLLLSTTSVLLWSINVKLLIHRLMSLPRKFTWRECRWIARKILLTLLSKGRVNRFGRLWILSKLLMSLIRLVERWIAF